VIVLVLLLYAVLAWAELHRRYKLGNRRDFAACAVLYAAGLLIAMLLALGVQIPSPSEPLRKLIKAILP
jgi:hypothetical protein